MRLGKLKEKGKGSMYSYQTSRFTFPMTNTNARGCRTRTGSKHTRLIAHMAHTFRFTLQVAVHICVVVEPLSASWCEIPAVCRH